MVWTLIAIAKNESSQICSRPVILKASRSVEHIHDFIELAQHTHDTATHNVHESALCCLRAVLYLWRLVRGMQL